MLWITSVFSRENLILQEGGFAQLISVACWGLASHVSSLPGACLPLSPGAAVGGSSQAARARHPLCEAAEAGAAPGAVMGETLPCQFVLCLPGDLGFPLAFINFVLGSSVCLYF